MDEQRTPHLNKYLPVVVLTTLWVAVCPTFAVWLLRDTGVIASPVVSILLASALALGASYVGGAIWKTRPGAGDLLFSDLLIWGWLRRRRSERQLADAVGLLGGVDAAHGMSREQREQMLVRLATSLEAADPHTHGHSRRVARHAAMIAKRMGLSHHEIAKVRTAAALHDIGKLDTPREILQKHGRLTDDEFAVIKQHPGRSAELVSILGDPELSAIVRHHHERIDGTGYPDGLTGEETPLAARIVSVADVFDAITSTRPYRPARPHKEALDVLTNEAGAQLDADAVRAFQSCYAGRRPLALWAMLTNLPEKLFVWLGAGANTVAGSVAGAVATSAVAGAVAVSAMASPLVASPHLGAAATNARPASSTAGAPTSQSASAFASAALKQPNPTLMSAGTHALSRTGVPRTGKSSAASGARSTTQPRPLTTSQPSSLPASSQSPGGTSAATGTAGQSGPSAATPAGSAGSGASGGQGSASGAGDSSSSGSGQSNPSHGGSTAGNQGNGKGSGSAGSQGNGSGQTNGDGHANGGQGNGNGSQSQATGSTGSQGNGNATGQGNGNATGQGNGNGQANGKTSSGTAQGQGSASGTAQNQAAAGTTKAPAAHGKTADYATTQN